MKKIIITALAAFVLISCAACSVRVHTASEADRAAELDALRAENARLSAELETVKAENAALASEVSKAAEADQHIALPVGGLYTRTGLIVDLDYDTDTVTVVDGADLVWQFSGCEDYCVGDLVEMLFQEAGEPQYIFDDVIVSTSYSGFYAEYFQD